MEIFTQEHLKKLWRARENSAGEDNGQITIIGGSALFHGAPIFSIKAASRIVDMVFFGSPGETMREVAAQIKAQSNSFIWVPWEEIEKYVEKSDAILIGPGMMRYNTENSKFKSQMTNGEFDGAGTETKRLTEYLLQKYPNKQWVIDGGSLQVLNPKFIPSRAILTPNAKEYERLFNDKIQMTNPQIKEEIAKIQNNAKKCQCIIVYKGPISYATDGDTIYEISGGNAGLTKGGTGDTLAGITIALAAKNPPLLAAAAASFVVKKTAEELEKTVGLNFNADDLAENVFKVWKAMQ